ncbi:hypothetical protein AYL99_06428 [Fonsecaea erecta]|uniref:MARVEL domain-containing protein n=1 Tax=Fonsecaea erecta TaxID=1367422 RepID=A0A178ZH69_9EURO|nr:hypothetical protein AYL99_06428 [Fonsecaea erecta]OAP59130.1 hypothetical protein AYL99_06428 [Fonsecaea erecta]
MTSKFLQNILEATSEISEFSNNHSPAHSSWVEILPHNHEPHTSVQKSEALVNPRRAFLLKQYDRLRYWTRITSGITNFISALFSIFTESIMIYTIYKLHITKDLFVEGRPWGPWARGSVLWPTFMLFTGSIITSLLALTALVALWCQAEHKAAFFSVLYATVHIVAWVVVSVVYKVEKTEKDLWGWSCTDKAKAIQHQLGSNKVDFESLCKLQVSLILSLSASNSLSKSASDRQRPAMSDTGSAQTSSWEVSVTEVVIKIFATGVSSYLDGKQEGLKTKLVGDVGSAVFGQLTG